jgi:hypothetical protein
LYYEVIQKIVGKKAKMRILKVNYEYIYKRGSWNGELLNIEQDKFIYCIWTENNIDDLYYLLAVCMPAIFEKE